MSLEVVIIGAVAAGPKAGCRIKRLDPGARVVMLDRDDLISYGGCGIPYFISGDVPELEGLLSTSFHFVRDAEFFRGAKGIEVLTRTEAVAVDRKAKKVLARRLDDGREISLSYDKLVIATGSENLVPPIPGVELEGVMPVGNLHQAQAVKQMVASGQLERAAIIGAGATGLELAEALNDLWGVEVEVFEMAGQVLPGLLDPEMARMVQTHLQGREGLRLHLESQVQAILDDGQGRVRGVSCGGREYPAELVILATGVRPNGRLAAQAGLEVDERGAVVVDEFLRTSDPDIFAGGDCVSLPHLLAKERVSLASGSLANRMGRVIGTNVCGGEARFPAVAGSFCIKLYGLAAARTGLDQDQARRAGFDPAAVLVVQADRAHFHPDQKLMYLTLVADRKSRRLLGCAALGENGDAVVGRINAVAGLLHRGARLEDVSNLELCYAPPLGAALDILNAAANTLENLIEGRLRPMSPAEFSRRLRDCEKEGVGDTVFLDMRAMDNVAPYLECHAPYWVYLPQETLAQRLDEVPRDKDVVLICNSGVRSYEAQCLLDHHGITNTYNLSGGVAAVKLWGEPILRPAEKEEE